MRNVWWFVFLVYYYISVISYALSYTLDINFVRFPIKNWDLLIAQILKKAEQQYFLLSIFQQEMIDPSLYQSSNKYKILLFLLQAAQFFCHIHIDIQKDFFKIYSNRVQSISKPISSSTTRNRKFVRIFLQGQCFLPFISNKVKKSGYWIQ